MFVGGGRVKSAIRRLEALVGSLPLEECAPSTALEFNVERKTVVT